MTAHPWGYGGGDVHTVRQCVGEEGIGRERERESESGGGRSRWEGIIDGWLSRIRSWAGSFGARPGRLTQLGFITGSPASRGRGEGLPIFAIPN